MHTLTPAVMGSNETPGVVARPPVMYAIAFVIVCLLRWMNPLPIFVDNIALWPGVAMTLIGSAAIIWGRMAMERAGTNIDPARPTHALITSGLFSHSRNPLYLALTLMFLGFTLICDTWWGFVALLPLLIVMHFGVVLREERYLERKFGAAYREYCSRVRRYV